MLSLTEALITTSAACFFVKMIIFLSFCHFIMRRDAQEIFICFDILGSAGFLFGFFFPPPVPQ